MRVMKKVAMFSLFVGTALFVRSAAATFSSVEYLPESSHYQGRVSYSTNADDGRLLRGRVDFAVYDTQGGNEFAAAGFTAPGSGRYVYAYQVFGQPNASDPLDYFAVKDIGVNAIAGKTDIGTADDGHSGIDASNAFFNPYPTTTTTDAVWEFTSTNVTQGTHSYFLVFSSDHNWKVGTYEVTPSSGELPIPGPEPATMALLSFGGVMLWAKRKKSV